MICISLNCPGPKKIIGSGNGSVLHRRQVITWINDPVRWRIGELPSLNELSEKTVPYKAQWNNNGRKCNTYKSKF